MALMKRLLTLFVLFTACCLPADEESDYFYYEPWRYESYPFPADPYYHSYQNAHYDGLRNTRYYYVSTSDFSLSQPYGGLSLGYSYGSFTGNGYPYTPWWSRYALIFNLSSKKILQLPEQAATPRIAGAAPLTFQEDEPKSPLELMLDEFLGTTNKSSEVEDQPAAQN
ncbi:MAG: hypothetical protein PHO37_09125 [Kiritimatiellae bacterium]|nr:hypothetical protein [Kiritimatiellia bacterium]